jgi:exonuclease III
MILLSLNIRGVRGPLKILSMCKIISKTKTDIIFLQETLVAKEKARKLMNILCPNWVICVVSSIGKLGVLLVAWNPICF